MLYEDKLAHARRLAKEWLESFEYLIIAEDEELQHYDENESDWDDIHDMIINGEILIGEN